MANGYAKYSGIGGGTGGGGSGVTSLNSLTGALNIVAGTGITVTPSGSNITIAATGAGSGTVTSVSVVTANGFAATITNPTTTPAITLSTTVTGLIKGNGTALSAAVAGTDYVIPSGSITGTATNITASSNSTLTTLSALSLPFSQVTGTVPVSQGGTSLTTLTANNVILGNGTSAPTFVAPGAIGNVLTSNGTTWVSSASGSGGANTSLSNLIATSINQSLVPNADAVFNLGSPGAQWLSLSTLTATIANIFTLTNQYTSSFWGGPNPGIVADSTSVGPSGSNAFLFATTDINGLVPDDTSGDISVQTGDNNNTSPSPTAKTGDLYLNTGYQNEATSSGNTGDINIETGQTVGSGNTGNISLTTGTKTSGIRGNIKFANGSEGSTGQIWMSTDTAGSGAWRTLSASSSFAFFASNAVTTRSSVVSTSPGFSTADNSPAFTFTPTISGTYKIYSNGGLLSDVAGGAPACRIFNTSGGAVLLKESQGVSYSSAGSAESSAFCQSVYTLTAGTTYIFDIQLGGPSNANAQLDGQLATFYMFAEGIALISPYQSPITPWNSTLVLTPAPGFGTTTNQVIETRVVGDSLEVQGSFLLGTSTASTAYILLPVGYAIDYTKINTAANQSQVGLFTSAESASHNIFNQTAITGAGIMMADGSTNDRIFLCGRGASTQFAKDNCNTMFNNGDLISFQFTIPIVGLFGGGVTDVSSLVKSASTGIFNFSNTKIPVLDFGGVTPVSATITTNGGDVEIGFQSDGTDQGTNSGTIWSDSTPTDSFVILYFYRDGNFIGASSQYMQNNIAIEIHGVPASSYKFIDSPPAGTHTYTAQVVGGVNRGDNGIYYSVLYAKPLPSFGLGGAGNNGNGQWIPYTPVFTGLGTVTGATFWYKTDGADSIFIKGTFTTGTPTGAIAQISLPNGYTSQASKMNGTIENVGGMAQAIQNTASFLVNIQPTSTNLVFDYNNDPASGGLNAGIANVVFAAGSTYSFSTTAIPVS